MTKKEGMRKVSFKTLGCRLNQYETDALVTQFHKAGYRIVDFTENADVIVINTCTVTNQSDQKSRNIISHAARRNPDAMVVVTGCMVNNHREKLESSDLITYVVDNERKSRIVHLVDAHFSGELLQPDNLEGDVFGFETVDKSLHTRTYIKIQDGCNNYCTFCIVPLVRGKAVSRPHEAILDNVRRVVDNGFKEIVITGVHIGRYAYEKLNFEKILEKILELPGDFRVRISSMEPDGFGPDFHYLFEHQKLTPHLHLCLQSGSEKMLLKMRRMYTPSSFKEILDKFRKYLPDFNFTTDIIVGFPGESDRDFDMTAELAREARFSHIHTFRYSRRKGTRADRMENQVAERIKSERSEVIRKISQENRILYLQSMLGKEQRVLVEKVGSNGIARGYGEHYFPVCFRAGDRTRNQFQNVMLDRLDLSVTPVVSAHIT